MPNSVALSFYNEMFDKGRIYNIRPAGLEALDLFRIEAGLLQPGPILWLQKKQSARTTRSPLARIIMARGSQ